MLDVIFLFIIFIFGNFLHQILTQTFVAALASTATVERNVPFPVHVCTPPRRSGCSIVVVERPGVSMYNLQPVPALVTPPSVAEQAHPEEE